MIKDFFVRNKPIFYIGLFTAASFFIIILLARSQSPLGSTKLIPLSESELITAYSPVTGSSDPIVTLIEISDFECPACASYHPIIKRLIQKYPQDLRVAYRHYPLPQHKNARSAAIAAQAVNRQGKFWEFAELLFENQDSLSKEKIKSLALELGVDGAKLDADIKDSAIEKEVNDDIAFGNSINIKGTPTFIINGTQVEGNLEQVVREIIEKKTVEQTPQVVETSSSESFEIKEISFSGSFFTPADTIAKKGQLVRITNSSDKDVKLSQNDYLVDSFTNGTVIKPNEAYEFRLTGNIQNNTVWTYFDENTKVTGTIEIELN
ncbi:hypothetical protein A3K34_00185 [candidate division WWE3 bacterium RIFOXYC1_FULL_40_10]|uniref:Thioredoxin domain-containing protein n=1 Tax=candidate division WWE3 bacterium RIFOXYA2_FULL_46_9 TaxID=1802636 RepID=A0A1F4W1E7_UNCKA|nr:MAG: hypothetical protein A3K58_00185 [candidate division WWE3 bacterium RIFOXYB1_FULL_40_22]OGC61311.1 MAG: hypothetical protein A3K37_00185 [candidate division WWE3 bacterium RIFOXYA1_FULL_40_11]OGC63221.1 MAG: hypothetical protein A2264_00840 [candidate division WWE3 bacterium RIFOXYA2_FULL_46_9]OGC65302.1 MAG: hypothetical protein A2326_04470 [candidate division WWE3 bacterium RIFOXYB2_FULL_41_6]OGC65694.1 MAG: hypothetical protein A3K34_00185 [candidate division WWE3 bacterium RIFOXYC1_